MKKTLIIIAALAMGAMCGCDKQKKTVSQEAAEKTEFACEKFDTVAYCDGFADAKLKISIGLCYAKGPNAGAINQQVLKCGVFTGEDLDLNGTEPIPEAIRKVAEYSIKMFREDVKHAAEGYGDMEAMADCYFNVTSRVERGRDSIINYMAAYDAFRGGNHPYDCNFYLNFDPATGKRIMPADVIADGASPKIAEKIGQSVAKEHGAASISELRDSEGIFDQGDPYVPQNFVMGKDSISFFYQCQEAGPYAAGEIGAKFAYGELQGLLK